MSPDDIVDKIRAFSLDDFLSVGFRFTMKHADARSLVANEINKLQARLDLIADIAAGSETANSLPHIAKIARGTSDRERYRAEIDRLNRTTDAEINAALTQDEHHG